MKPGYSSKTNSWLPVHVRLKLSMAAFAEVLPFITLDRKSRARAQYLVDADDGDIVFVKRLQALQERIHIAHELLSSIPAEILYVQRTYFEL